MQKKVLIIDDDKKLFNTNNIESAKYVKNIVPLNCPMFGCQNILRFLAQMSEFSM